MKLIFTISLLICLLHTVICSPLRVIKQNEGIKNIENLDKEGRIVLSWEVDVVKSEITFEIEAMTLGYVGFGISPTGSMTGADIFIAGVNPNGTFYSSDRHGVGFVMPEIDSHPDWTLLDAREVEGNYTYLKFSRLLNTCDEEEDYPITDGTNRLIWAMGTTDDLAQHLSDNRGSRSVNLLAAPTPPVDLDKMIQWNATLDMNMPEETTAYWCSLHKGPVLDKKHHVVAFDALLPDANALKHTHHFIIYNCYLPADGSLDEAFEQSTVDKGENGDFCYQPNDRLPFMGDECDEYLYVWAKGGKKMVFPENVGYPIGEDDNGKQRYYKLEIHYDNPEGLKDVRFSTGVNVYYTEEIRTHDAGQLTIGHDVNVALIVPPNSVDFITAGHCSGECTSAFPEEGLHVFNSLLHSHLTGRKLKVRHFREGVELPFLDYDNNYDFDYQQNKPLVEYVTVKPGDQLTYECTYDSRWKNGEVVLGGLSTVDEMCEAFLWYYPKQDIDVCGSSYPGDIGFLDFGITNVTEVEAVGKNSYNILEPEHLRGDFEDAMNHKIVWTDESKVELEQKRRFSEHYAICVNRKNPQEWSGVVKYPENLVEYIPENQCDGTTGSTDPNTGSTDSNTGSTNPNTGSTNPNTGSTNPNTGSTDSNTGSTDPDTSTTDSSKATTTYSNVIMLGFMTLLICSLYRV